MENFVDIMGHLSIIQNYKRYISNVKEESVYGWTNALFSTKGMAKESHNESFCNIPKIKVK